VLGLVRRGRQRRWFVGDLRRCVDGALRSNWRENSRLVRRRFGGVSLVGCVCVGGGGNFASLTRVLVALSAHVNRVILELVYNVGVSASYITTRVLEVS
jgi:hypothetical protein